MFKIYDGREYFYQWDLERKLIVNDETIKEVHFCNKTDECSLVCEVYKDGELNVVNVPNVLLQDDWRINVYAYDGNYTKHSDRFDVKSRSKPADYIYTETELKNYDDLEGRIAALEQSGGSVGGNVDLTGYATKTYVDTATDTINRIVKNHTNIGKFISFKDITLAINTTTDEITINEGYLYVRKGRWDVKQQTVKRETSTSITYLVYDTSITNTTQRIKNINPNNMTDNQIIIAILTRGNGYEKKENTNYIPGRWTVDGVVYPEPVGLYDVNNRLNTLESKDFSLQWYALGDSVTEGIYSYLNDSGTGVNAKDASNCWAALAAKYNGWTLTNKGVGGSGYVSKGSSGGVLNAREQVDSIDFTNAELVTLAYGVNDWLHNKELGTFDDDIETGGTFYSNMRYCIEKIMAEKPNIKIVVISPINCWGKGEYNSNWAAGFEFSHIGTLEDVYQAEKEICNYYGIEFIDMLHSSVINRLNIEAALLDRVHPSLAFHKAIAAELSRKLIAVNSVVSVVNTVSSGFATEQMELIASGTNTEPIRRFRINVDNDGNAFELTKAFFRVSNFYDNAGGGGNLGCHITLGGEVIVGAMMPTTSDDTKNKMVIAYADTNGVMWTAQGGGGIYHKGGVLADTSFPVGQTITQAEFTTADAGKNLAPGATYELWGVRK